jgi:hypothetical protein
LHYIRRGAARQELSPVHRPVRLEIMDVQVNVAFWEDASGRLDFICAPQQQPFFRAMRFDQLTAQIQP